MDGTSQTPGGELPLAGHVLAFTGTSRSADGIPQALRALAAIGYRGVELMGLDHDPALLAASGLTVAACHGVPADWSDLAQLQARCDALQCRDLCSSGPLAWGERGVEDYRATAQALTRIGRALRDLGIHLHYHNHDFEFTAIDGTTTGFDILCDELAADACDFCVDLGWVHRAGRDPVTLLAALGDRVGHVHLRDFAGAASVPLGTGDVDLRAQLPALRALRRCRAVVVEQDQSPRPDQDMASSLRHLRRIGW